VRIDGHEKQYRDFRPDSEALYTITIKVDEIIKGPRRGTAEFVATTMASDDQFERFVARRTSFLCFGNTTSDATNSKTLPSRWDAIALVHSVPSELLVSRRRLPDIRLSVKGAKRERNAESSDQRGRTKQDIDFHVPE
jgi:hypothetical protein